MSHDLQSRIRNLRSAERRITPDAAWVRRTRATLSMQVKNTLPTGQPSFTHRTREFFQLVVVSKLAQAVRKPAMAALSVFVVAMGGSILSVSAAERSLPGDFFYGLKLVTEQARLALTSTKEDKLKLKTEFTGRRVNEFQQIVNQPASQDQVAEVTEILKRDLNTLKQQLSDVTDNASPATAVAAAKLVDRQTNQVISDLQANKSQLSAETKEKITEVQSAAADTGVKAIEVLAEQHQQSNDSVPATDIAEAIQYHTRLLADVTASSSIITPFTGSGFASSTQITSSTLSGIVNQVKDLTTQAYAQQKVQDQLDIAAGSATGTTDASAPSNATSSAAASSTGTTAASTSGTKLILQ